MKKIAIFQKDLSIGGIQKSLINILNILDKKYQIDLYLYNQKNNFYLDMVPKKVNIIYMDSKRLNQFMPFTIFNKLNKKKYLNKKYDITIDYNGYQNDTACGAINCVSAKKIVWIHSDLKERYQYEKKYRFLFKLSKKKYSLFSSYVFVSSGAKEGFTNLLKIKDKEMTVIGNQIDDKSILEKAQETCELTVDEKKYNIITTGRMVYAKGFDLLLHDFKRLLDCRRDVHLYFLGDGEEKEKLIKLANDLKISDDVTFLGRQNNPYKYMKLMDAFVLTSRYEGQGIVIMEAKVLGLELFISKNLEKYNEGEFTGFTDIVDGLKKAKKKPKKESNLDKYNQKNQEKLYQILD